ncbi:chemotaxis response regulator CheY [Candidatus Sumerlaeota bacterium]|nr:chemotaxis response regulator CheY [Candidatus Sumerlaeota bacterium]
MTASGDISILIVDDFSTMRRVMRNTLHQLGFHNLDEANDGAAALEKLKTGAYDLVVTDWDMPNMTGLELLKAIRAQETLRSIPVLMVTAEAEKEKVFAAAQAGVTNYVVKPFAPEVIRQKIDSIFK